MPSHLLVIGLVPAPDFSRFLGELRARYPEASLTALIGHPSLRDGGAEDYLLWSDYSPRVLADELRRRRFSLFVIAFNREYYFTLTFWKVLLLILASRARGVLFCEQARLPEKVTPLAHLTGMPFRVFLMWLAVIWRYVYYFGRIALSQLLLLGLGALLLIPLLGLLLVDFGVFVARLFRPPRRNQAAS